MTRLRDYLVDITGLLQFTLPVTPLAPFSYPRSIYRNDGRIPSNFSKHFTSRKLGSRVRGWLGQTCGLPKVIQWNWIVLAPKGDFFLCLYLQGLFVFTMSVISFVILNVCVCLNTWSERSPITPTTQANVGPVVSAPPQVADSG